ncbi:Ataxin-2 [Portunus trituberculatus]|uniref:Ataxin-2 n=1 Tax=Portunus trituberculatus TaxID=210409 RepID=A0A5B7CHQ9_PORTR|nr:Ataxin-2 [Portunus trituberculatus]
MRTYHKDLPRPCGPPVSMWRGGRGGKGAERQVSADGVYTNHRFMQAVGALVGLPVRIQTKTNEIIEGVFTTFSPNFDLVLDLAHQVSRTDPSTINPETIKPKMIFTAADIVTIKVVNVDLEYATRDGFAVDQVISRYNGQGGEKALEPWQGEPTADDCLGLGDENSRSPSTTTPPRPHTPTQIPPNQPPQIPAGPPVGIPHMVLTSQPFAIPSQPPRFPKRVPVGNNQRQEYTSQLQVAAATGQPILAPGHMGTQTQPITAYPPLPIMMRFPHAGMPMVTAMVPTSVGLCHPNPDSQQPSQQHGHQPMYMAQPSLPPHQPHPTHTPGPLPQPTQPPTPQNPGSGSGPPNMPNPPSTPGPSQPQQILYPMGGQPSLPQHLSQHSPHTAQSPHTQQYPGPGQGATGAGGHHGGPGQQMTQYVVLPSHMMHPSGPPPHSAAHIPSSMPGFTPTSTATVQQLPSAPHIQYFPSWVINPSLGTAGIVVGGHKLRQCLYPQVHLAAMVTQCPSSITANEVWAQ